MPEKPPTEAGRPSPAADPAVNPLGWVPIAFIAWAVVFGGYEVVERTLLVRAPADLLHLLHIARGTGTSFLLAGLVAWYALRWRTPQAAPAVLTGLKVIVVETEARELAAQSAWIVRLRWIAVAGVVAVALVCRYAFGVISTLSAVALLLTAVAMAAYNSALSASRLRGVPTSRGAFAQVFLDLTALTLMLAFTGGLQNPFFLFYIFHVVIAGILLRRSDTYVVTAAACVFFCGMGLLQESGFLPYYPLLRGGVPDAPLHAARGWLHVAGVLGAFVMATWCTAYFTTTIVDKLRQRGAQVLEAGEILMQERAKTEDIVRSVGAGLLILDLQGVILWANDIARAWFGPDLAGRRCHQVLGRQPERCANCPVPQALHAGTPAACEQRFVRDGQSRFFFCTSSPIRGADGRVEQILELVQDITANKEMEIQLLQAGKMVAVGQLAAGIAHEINNPLAVVASSAEILAGAAAAPGAGGVAPDVLDRHLRKIEANVFRCKGIIQNLLAFARRDGEGLEEVSLGDVLEDTLGLVESSARARGRTILRAWVETDGAPDLRIRTDARKLQQVVLNLVLNALDATDPGGRVTVSAAPADGGVEIAVADTGHGIAPEHLDRLFEPFFTTKPVGKGTGLGLYLCHQFIETLGGRISVQSRVGEGTTFRIRLPAQGPPAVRPTTAVPEMRGRA